MVKWNGQVNSDWTCEEAMLDAEIVKWHGQVKWSKQVKAAYGCQIGLLNSQMMWGKEKALYEQTGGKKIKWKGLPVVKWK